MHEPVDLASKMEDHLQAVEQPTYQGDAELDTLQLESSLDDLRLDTDVMLAEVANKLDGAREHHVKKLHLMVDCDAIRSKSAQALLESQASVRQLAASLSEYKQRADQNKRIVSDRIERLRAAKREMDTVIAEAQGLEGEISEVNAIIHSNENVVSEHEQQVESLGSATALRSNELSAALAQYKNWLGISFRQDADGDNVKVVFTDVDRKLPEKEYSFKLKLNDRRNYEVSECEPSIPLQDLVEKLIATNNLRKFIVETRKLFIATVSVGEGGST